MATAYEIPDTASCPSNKCNIKQCRVLGNLYKKPRFQLFFFISITPVTIIIFYKQDNAKQFDNNSSNGKETIYYLSKLIYYVLRSFLFCYVF